MPVAEINIDSRHAKLGVTVTATATIDKSNTMKNANHAIIHSDWLDRYLYLLPD